MVASSPEPDPALVARLRAAGCVFAEEEAVLLADRPELVDRRVAGEPLEHLLGWAAFLGRRFVVAPGVFVPRTRSGALVDVAAAATAPGSVVVDLCCGCGALGLSLADRVDGLQLHLADLDPVALDCARANARGAAVVHQGDLWEALPSRLHGGVDVVLVNAPYVPTTDVALMPREAWQHERRAALDGGGDGLAVHRRVLAGLGEWLRPGGRAHAELADLQVDAWLSAARAHGLAADARTDPDREVVVATATRRT